MDQNEKSSLRTFLTLSLILHSAGLGGITVLASAISTTVFSPGVMVVDLVSLPGGLVTLPGKEMTVTIQTPTVQDQTLVSDRVDQIPLVHPEMVLKTKELKQDTRMNFKIEESEPAPVIPEDNSLISGSVSGTSIPGFIGDSASREDPCNSTPCRPSMDTFLQKVRSRLEKAKRYPWMARIRGLEGISHVKFQITIEGNVNEVEIVRPSRHEILDKAAVETVWRAAPFPTFPKQIDVDHLEINLPLVFKLQ